MTMKAVLGLGGNLGDREQNLAAALDGLEQLPGTQILALSNVYETEPFDVTDSQDNYLNCCALLETALSPEELLDRCLALEVKLGRVRTGYHSARTVDIDLLLCEGAVSNTEKLTLPHPRIRERAFVMVPLSDLFPGHQALATISTTPTRPWIRAGCCCTNRPHHGAHKKRGVCHAGARSGTTFCGNGPAGEGR